MHKRKNRLILGLSLLLVAGFLLTSLASYFVSLASLRRQIVSHELPLTRDSVYSEVQRDLLRPVFLASLMAHDTFLRDWVTNGEKPAEEMTKYLKEIQEEYGTFTSFFVSEKTRIYYQANGILKTVKETEERDRWYFRVREMAEPYEINVDPDMANDDATTIFINYRVHDQVGNYIGATGVGLMVYAVRDILARYQEEYGCTVFFADRDGRIVLRSRGTPIQADDLRGITGLRTIASDILGSVGEPLSYASKEGTVHVNARFVKELGWHLIALQPEARQVRGIRRALLANLGICALITGLILLLTNATISAYQRRIEKLVTTDPLTGLYNRRAFGVLFDAAVRDCGRRGTRCSLVLFDVDYLKRANDTHGHAAGDALLQDVGRSACAALRLSDTVCRWGGDEFVVVLKDCSQDDASVIAEKIRHAVAGSGIAHGGHPIPVTVSLGVAEILPQESENDALQRADQALYRAKEGGRNQTEVAAKAPARPHGDA